MIKNDVAVITFGRNHWKELIAVQKIPSLENGTTCYWVFYKDLEFINTVNLDWYGSDYTKSRYTYFGFKSKDGNLFDQLVQHYNGNLEPYDAPDEFTPINSQEELNKYFMLEELLK